MTTARPGLRAWPGAECRFLLLRDLQVELNLENTGDAP